MFRKAIAQALVVVAAGGLLGFEAAAENVRLNWFATRTAAQAEESIVIEILVPADAVLTIGSQKMTSIGAVRHFETPPLKVGSRYQYEVTVRHGDKEYRRLIDLEHGQTNRFDFRTDPSEARPAGKPERVPMPLRSERVAVPPGDPLPSWNDGAAKKAILAFVRVTTDKGSAKYVPPEQRIATFDQDGTLWVEHPMYTQVIYCLDRVPAVVKERPELKDREPFKTVLSGDREAIARLPLKELEEILFATLSGMPVEEFTAEVKNWLAKAKHPRWKRPYTELTYQPMLEVLAYFRANGYKTYIVTGGGQDFVRVYAEQVYGIPPEQVVGSAEGIKYGYDKDGKPFLTKEPRLLLNDNNAGKPEGIHLMIGRRPVAAFGNSTGDRQMLEYTTAGDGARLGILVFHDDVRREYAYGPAEGLPDTRVGTFTQALYDEAGKRGWVVISMKKDWKRLFPFDR
jgi:uncharacterized protein (TIGR03000 family)